MVQISLPEIGTRIGPYEVRAHIGGGGMAALYKAWHTGLERYEALKFPRSPVTSGNEVDFVQRLLDEARVAAGLHHPHIVSIHSVSEADAPVPFFAMDLVEGLDLQQLIKERGRLDLQETIDILRQVGAALDYAHSRGVIHRDVKPANILLHTDNNLTDHWVKVVDFGISRAVEDPGGTRVTSNGLYVGTPEYMSPEQSGSGAPVDYRTDIYSLGIVAYEMLSGQPPFVAEEGVSRISVILKHVNQLPEPLNQRLEDVSLAVNDAILKSLAKDPNQRFQSCADFLQALETAMMYTGQSVVSRVPSEATGAALPSHANSRSLLVTASTVNEPTLDSTKPEFLSYPTPQRAPLRSLLLAALGGMVAAALLIFGFIVPQLGGSNTSDGRSMLLAQTSVPGSSAVVGSTSTIDKPFPVSNAPVVKKEDVAKKSGHLKKAGIGLTIRTRLVRSRRRVTVPYPRWTRKSRALLQGQRRLKRRGVKGVKEELVANTMHGKRRVSSRLVRTWMVKRPVPEIQVLGIAAPSRPRRITKVGSRNVGKTLVQKSVFRGAKNPGYKVKPNRKVAPRKRATKKASHKRRIAHIDSKKTGTVKPHSKRHHRRANKRKGSPPRSDALIIFGRDAARAQFGLRELGYYKKIFKQIRR